MDRVVLAQLGGGISLFACHRQFAGAQGAPCFHLALGPADYIAGPAHRCAQDLCRNVDKWAVSSKYSAKNLYLIMVSSIRCY